MLDADSSRDAQIEALRTLIYRAALDAVQGSDEIRNLVVNLQRAGVQIRIKVCAGVQWSPPDWTAAERTARERRWCPRCSRRDAPFYLRGRVVRERILLKDDREVIDEPQVRFTCSACGYGEVEPVAPRAAE